MHKSEVKFKETSLGKIPDDFKRGDDLVKAISEFLLKECFLLKYDINERSITHKLAEYVQKYFSDYNVDCEYNRMPNERDERNNNGEARKEFISKALKLYPSQTSSDDDKGTTVYPDIIIHKRGSNKSNLIVIEAKKETNVTEKSKEFDFRKLKAFTKSDGLGYKYGIYLELNENSNDGLKELKFFRDGAEYNGV